MYLFRLLWWQSGPNLLRDKRQGHLSPLFGNHVQQRIYDLLISEKTKNKNNKDWIKHLWWCMKRRWILQKTWGWQLSGRSATSPCPCGQGLSGATSTTGERYLKSGQYPEHSKGNQNHTAVKSSGSRTRLPGSESMVGWGKLLNSSVPQCPWLLTGLLPGLNALRLVPKASRTVPDTQ